MVAFFECSRILVRNLRSWVICSWGFKMLVLVRDGLGKRWGQFWEKARLVLGEKQGQFWVSVGVILEVVCNR